MPRALVAGHVCIDLIPDLAGPVDVTPGGLVEAEPMTMHPGGCVANTGTDLLALGAPAGLPGDVGDDERLQPGGAAMGAAGAAALKVSVRHGLTRYAGSAIAASGVDAEDRAGWERGRLGAGPAGCFHRARGSPVQRGPELAAGAEQGGAATRAGATAGSSGGAVSPSRAIGTDRR